MEQAIVTYTTPVVKLHYLNYTVIEVPSIILDQLPGKFNKGNYNQRLIIRLDDAIEWQCGLQGMGEGSACVTIHSKRLKELKKVLGDDVEVSFFKDESTYGVEVAEEMAEYWAQDSEAFRRFSELIPSMQRYILNYVTTVKNPDKRMERTVLLMRNLVQSTEGKETFRELLGK
jgi:hypothetical protein